MKEYIVLQIIVQIILHFTILLIYIINKLDVL